MLTGLSKENKINFFWTTFLNVTQIRNDDTKTWLFSFYSINVFSKIVGKWMTKRIENRTFYEQSSSSMVQKLWSKHICLPSIRTKNHDIKTSSIVFLKNSEIKTTIKSSIGLSKEKHICGINNKVGLDTN